MTELAIHPTPIPGLLVIELPVHGDNRGWFKENWQRAKMTELGLPDLGPVQNNISFNATTGTTRGLHAEPWDKYVSLATGRIFGAWADLREGPSFGTVFTIELTPERAVYVPRGVANGFQTLEADTAYTYLVNDHWSQEAQAQYTFVNLADPTLDIHWPIALENAEMSDKDKAHPQLADVVPMPPKKTLILGSRGQLGKALSRILPHAEATDRTELDITSDTLATDRNWAQYDTIINAAAYTDVDGAETAEGRRSAWKINVSAIVGLARIATEHGITLVNVSSDYVFDGVAESHDEDEDFAPLSVYGATKAAGDAVTATVPRHYIVRTSWVIGEGNNFIQTMRNLAERGISPTVVDDQIGSLTSAEDLADAIVALLHSDAAYGTYNVTSDTGPESWADIAKRVFVDAGRDAHDVTPVTTAEYFAGKEGVAVRPTNSGLPLAKIADATNWSPKHPPR